MVPASGWPLLLDNEDDVSRVAELGSAGAAFRLNIVLTESKVCVHSEDGDAAELGPLSASCSGPSTVPSRAVGEPDARAVLHA